MSSFKDKIAKARTSGPATADIDIALDTSSVTTIAEIEQEITSANIRYDVAARALRDEEAEYAREERMTDPRIEDVKQRLAAAEEERDRDIAALQDKLAEASQQASESMITIRLTRLPGQRWAEICAMNGPRPGVILDSRYGYDYQAVAREAVQEAGLYVDGDDSRPLEPAEWTELLDLMSGHDFEQMCMTMFGLNEWGPEQAVRVLGKASRDAASKKSPSH